MKPLKKFCALLLMTLPAVVLAQKVTVSKDTERVKGGDMNGYATELAGTIEDVSASYTKYLKTFGKIKSSGNQIQLSEAEISFNKYSTPIYATTRSKGEKIIVWLGLNASEWPTPEQANQALKDLEKVVYDFGVKYYRDRVQLDIDESTRAQQAAEKQTQRLQNESKNLGTRLEFNAKEKLRLEKALADNKLEFETLTSSVARNKKEQDSVTLATEQIKKRVETHKDRQRKVN
jgi:hypothetical protein